jgi:drug/metabolite transporter (DMT)-like permease
MLKIGVTEMAPLTFRAVTLPFAALGLLLVAWLSGDNVRIPREWWSKVAVLAAFNITGWNSFVLFGVQQMPAGRSAILAFTMPIWATLIASVVLHERRGFLSGLLLGMCGIALLIGDEIRVISRPLARR